MPIYSTKTAIPKMTSNTSPSGRASASSEWVDKDNDRSAYNAFNDSRGWSTYKVTTGWIAYEFIEPKLIYKYSIGQTSTIFNPKSWFFEGTNDDVSWVQLDEQTNVSPWLANQGLNFKYFNIQNPQYFKKYRLRVTRGTPNGEYYFLQIDSIELYEIIYPNKILLSSSNKTYSLTPLIYATETAIPKMTSNTTPSGRAFASSEATTGFSAGQAFDRIENGYASPNGSNGIGFLGYEFVSNITIGKYSLRSYGNSFNAIPKDWSFEGSNNGVNWTVLDMQANQTWTTAYTDKEYVIDINKVGSYKMYRINWTANNGGTQIIINELKMFEATIPQLITLPNQSEQTFINHGMESSIPITQLDGIKSIESNSTAHESGKKFTHTVDLSKRIVDKIILS